MAVQRPFSWILSASQVLGILKGPVRETYYGHYCLRAPPRDFVVYRPFGAPKASIWNFVMIHVCVNVGCFPFDCSFFCRIANVIFFELVVFSF